MKRLICFLLVSIIATSFLVAGRRSCIYQRRRLSPGTHTIECVQVTCYRNGTVNAEPCPEIKVSCESNTHAVNRPQDNSLGYPGCCPFPICVPDE